MVETFDFLRPVYYLITFFLICNFLYLTFFKEKIRSNLYVLLNSIFFTVIGLVLLFQQGIIVDELNMSGDSVIFYLSILLVGITLISFLFSLLKKK
ncbi:hypothetical protein BN988_01589 [Oceanobacillus picturae]|uniref:Uncharacterized protein n=1 Tax=Oceanobacillus picturae TaxID=171693 RepID=W9ABJ9_9BACI|nr:hypothetical protein BN988_01589 [Oceanobacillus picturae]